MYVCMIVCVCNGCMYVCMYTVSGISAVWETKSGTKDGAYSTIYCSVCVCVCVCVYNNWIIFQG